MCVCVCRRCPCEAALHVIPVIFSSTSQEAFDLRTRGLADGLPEVPRAAGQSLRTVWHAAGSPPSQPHHRGAQQDPGPHHAEVREVRTSTPRATESNMLSERCFLQAGAVRSHPAALHCWPTGGVFAGRSVQPLAVGRLYKHRDLTLACLAQHPSCNCVPSCDLRLCPYS